MQLFEGKQRGLLNAVKQPQHAMQSTPSSCASLSGTPAGSATHFVVAPAQHIAVIVSADRRLRLMTRLQ